MTFPFTLAAALVCLSLGGVLGNLLCIINGNIFRKKYAHFRVSCIFILLCIAAAGVAWGFVLLPSIDYLLSLKSSDIIWLLILFLIGAASLVSFRIVFPCVLLFYITIAFASAVHFYNRFGASRNSVSVLIRQNVLEVEGKKFPVSGMQNPELVVEMIYIPAKALLPIPRRWYYIAGVCDKTTEPKVINLEEKTAHTIVTCCNRFFDYLTGTPVIVFIPVSIETQPSGYTLEFSDIAGKTHPALIKIY